MPKGISLLDSPDFLIFYSCKYNFYPVRINQMTVLSPINDL